MTSIHRYDGKDRRRERRRNHIVKDLKSNKYRQRVVPGKRTDEVCDDDDYEYTDIDPTDGVQAI